MAANEFFRLALHSTGEPTEHATEGACRAANGAAALLPRVRPRVRRGVLFEIPRIAAKLRRRTNGAAECHDVRAAGSAGQIWAGPMQSERIMHAGVASFQWHEGFA